MDGWPMVGDLGVENESEHEQHLNHLLPMFIHTKQSHLQLGTPRVHFSTQSPMDDGN